MGCGTLPNEDKKNLQKKAPDPFNFPVTEEFCVYFPSIIILFALIGLVL